MGHWELTKWTRVWSVNLLAVAFFLISRFLAGSTCRLGVRNAATPKHNRCWNVPMDRVRLRKFRVLAGLSLVVGIAGLVVPRISTGPTPGFQERGIIENLRTLDQAKNAWAADTRSGKGAVPTESDLAPYFNGSKFPEPLLGERYQIRGIGESPTATLGNRLIDGASSGNASIWR